MSCKRLLFHLSQSQSSAASPSFNRLSRQKCNLPGSPRMNQILYHSLKFKIVHVSDVNFCLKLFPAHAVIHCFFPVVAESQIFQVVFQISDFCSCERRPINNFSRQRSSFSPKQFHQITHTHSCRNSVRIENQVRLYSARSKWNIIHVCYSSDNTFLSVRRRKFVSRFRQS